MVSSPALPAPNFYVSTANILEIRKHQCFSLIIMIMIIMVIIIIIIILIIIVIIIRRALGPTACETS